MDIVLVDTEYTTWPGALESGWSGPGEHREIVQVAAVRLSPSFDEVGSLDLLVRPAVNPVLSPLFTDLTRIGQAEVDARGMSFPEALEEFLDFAWHGNVPVVCMNADEAVFRENCRLSGIDFPFERPWHRLRPFLEEQGVDVVRHSSGDLHRLTDSPLEGHAHNALHDVRSMGRWLRHAAGTGAFRELGQLPVGAPDRDPRSGPRPAP